MSRAEGRLRMTALAIALVLGATGCQNLSSTAPASAKASPASGASPRRAVGQPIDAPAAASTPQGSPLGGAAVKPMPTDPTEVAAMGQDPPKPASRDGFRSLSFADLSGFTYETDQAGVPTPNSVIPKPIKDLNKEQVALSGFAIPLEFSGDQVSAMLLVRNQLLCCFGQEPKFNEWAFVIVHPPSAVPLDVPVTVSGTLYTEPDFEGEQVLTLYRMNAHKVDKLEAY